ncbi:MAG: 30S ribosomal protein S6 [Ruminococcaceae bacterium]|nr:30S ribosomal protein S6 [Oscillospiraceae bacterium]
MEKKIGSYETMFIVNPQLSEDDTKAIVEKFTALMAENGEIEQVNEWGKRRLAYPINDLMEGYYVLVNHKADTQFIAELTRLFNINENIMRSMTIANA